MQLVSASWPDLSVQNQWTAHQVCEHCQVGLAVGVRVWTQPTPERLMVPASEHSVSPDSRVSQAVMLVATDLH